MNREPHREPQPPALRVELRYLALVDVRGATLDDPVERRVDHVLVDDPRATPEDGADVSASLHNVHSLLEDPVRLRERPAVSIDKRLGLLLRNAEHVCDLLDPGAVEAGE